MSQDRIVITGIGLTAPNGNSLAEFRAARIEDLGDSVGVEEDPISRVEPRPMFGFRRETVGQDADDRARPSVKLQGFTDHGWRTSKAITPEPFRQHHHVVLPADLLILR